MKLKNFSKKHEALSICNNQDGFGRSEKDVNKIKNHTASAIERVHIVAFGLYYIIEAILDNKFFKIFPEGVWGEVFRVIFAAIGYATLFFALKCFHSLFLIVTDSKFNLKKDWYHVHIPIKLDGNVDFGKHCLSAGNMKICRTLNDFTFVGDNYDYCCVNGEVKKDETRHTKWQTETSEICDSDNSVDVIEVYSAQTNIDETLFIEYCPVCKKKYKNPIEIQRNNRNRYGIHRYHILRNGRSKRIECDYTDCWPSLKYGKLYLYDNPIDRDEKIKWYFNEKNKLAISPTGK